ncbi:protein FAR-RED IMPAIRED RESPONSE 1-like [Spinacia oleracea]|uniref:Protein FAR-RED IMPAIRED RESPONSE 1-like n=1 Tax=Spinacia oleracea TaxID=3562 RepID=A0ABM3QRP5_SPIOL|nr:protein FAR-RED IMPAIRED RESPONSE 1-like [Spinacia oleracea]
MDKLFWCDGMSRNDYMEFGNVIAFDTTNKVNAYHKPLVVIVVVNHHRQSVVVSFSLVSHEKEETFKWILEQLTEAGDNIAPHTDLTDGDKAMTNAISFVFPKPVHRLYLWNLMRNVKGHSSKTFCSGFMKCMRSTQRCESMNSSMKTVFNQKIMLYKFVELYDQSVERYKVHKIRPRLPNEAHNSDYQRGPFRKAQYIVIHRAKLHKMYCCCMKLESVGIPCRHMFAVMKYGRMTEIPRGCILRRWTKYAKAGLSYGHTLDEFNEQTDTSFVGRFAYLNGLGIQICRLAARSYNGSLWLKNVLSKVLISLETRDEKAEGIPKKATLVGIGDPKVLQADMGLKKKDAKPQEKSNSSEKPKSIDLNQSQSTTPIVTSNIGLGEPSFLLGDLMPGTYTSGEASEAVDNYEVSQYKTEPTVFYWGPRQHW